MPPLKATAIAAEMAIISPQNERAAPARAGAGPRRADAIATARDATHSNSPRIAAARRTALRMPYAMLLTYSST
eukprot:6177180-Pleurochrysis_carterae.AAC.5